MQPHLYQLGSNLLLNGDYFDVACREQVQAKQTAAKGGSHA